MMKSIRKNYIINKIDIEVRDYNKKYIYNKAISHTTY